MKKILLFLLVLIVLLMVGLYTLIPTKLKISSLSYIECPDNAATRILSDESNWKLWWPDSVANNGGPASNGAIGSRTTTGSFFYNGNTFTVKQRSFNGMVLLVSFAGKNIDGEFVHAASSNDSLAAVLQYNVTLSLNPIARIRQYMEAQQLKKNSSAILDHLKEFLEKKENVYRITIKEIRVTDTIMVSTFFSSPTYPSTEKTYEAINSLKKYIAANGGAETGFPMLNVTLLDSSNYKARVAIPINKAIKENASMQLKKMIPGRILVTEIKGGPQAVKDAYIQLHYYLSDNDFASPAIPFESLITNRSQEKDSSRWITRIYYPIL
jgi:effector-binding domain-containing protein